MAWTKPVASFNKDLSRGRLGELALMEAFGGSVIATDGRKGDMKVATTGHVLEVKTDYYSMSKTPNFFMERYSWGDKPGGPHQSLEHGSKYFIYMFADPGKFFIFETKALVRRLNQIEATGLYDIINIPNRGYVSRGFKIHRELFSDLELSWEDIGVKFDEQRYKEFINWNKAER